MSFERRDTVIGGRKVTYWERGIQYAQTVVVLHGFPGNHHGLIDMAREFDQYHIVMPDLPACGASEALSVRHSLCNFSSWLLKFIDAVHLTNPIIVGHSFGARLTLEFASQHPQVPQAIVLVTPVVKVDGWIEKAGMALGDLLPMTLRVGLIKNSLYQRAASWVMFKSASPLRRQKLEEENAREVAHLNPRATYEITKEVRTRDLTHLAHLVTVPTLVIAGGADKVATVQSLTEFSYKLPRGTLYIMKGAGHILPLEEPGTVAHIIATWLKGRYHI